MDLLAPVLRQPRDHPLNQGPPRQQRDEVQFLTTKPVGPEQALLALDDEEGPPPLLRLGVGALRAGPAQRRVELEGPSALLPTPLPAVKVPSGWGTSAA